MPFAFQGYSVRDPVPPAAAAVGYNTQTLGPRIQMGTNWYDYNGQGKAVLPGAWVLNGDGSVSLPGPNGAGYNATISTAHKPGSSWIGTAYGGGWYIEATFRVDNPTITTSPGATVPAFWADSVHFLYQDSTGGYIHWTGQAPNFGHHIELDMFEWSRNSLLYYNSNNALDWYGASGALNNGLTGGNNQTKFGAVSVSSYFTIGSLWVPATPSTQGYLKRYLNNFEVFPAIGVPKNTVWNYWDNTNPPAPIGGTPAGTAPAVGTTAMSWLDQSLMMPIFGTAVAPDGTSNGMTIASCSIWQKDASKNLTQ